MATSKAMAEAKKRAAAYHKKRRAKKKKKAKKTKRAAGEKAIKQKARDRAAGIKPRAAESLFGEGAMGGKAREHSKRVKRALYD